MPKGFPSCLVIGFSWVGHLGPLAEVLILDVGVLTKIYLKLVLIDCFYWYFNMFDHVVEQCLVFPTSINIEQKIF